MAISLINTQVGSGKAQYSWLGERMPNPEWDGTDQNSQYIPLNLNLSTPE